MSSAYMMPASSRPGGSRVGFLTSGRSWLHECKSVALALVDDGFAGEGTAFCVHIVGVAAGAGYRGLACDP